MDTSIISIQATSSEAIPYERDEIKKKKKITFSSISSRENTQIRRTGAETMDFPTNVGEACTEQLLRPRAEPRR